MKKGPALIPVPALLCAVVSGRYWLKAPGIDLLRDTVSAFRPKAARLFGAGDPDIQTAFKMLLNGFMIIPGLG